MGGLSFKKKQRKQHDFSCQFRQFFPFLKYKKYILNVDESLIDSYSIVIVLCDFFSDHNLVVNGIDCSLSRDKTYDLIFYGKPT